MTIEVRLERIKDMMSIFPVFYLGEGGCVLFDPIVLKEGLKINRMVISWSKYIKKDEIISAVGFQLDPDRSPEDLMDRVADLLEANSPCDDTEIVALRSGLVQKITFTDE